MKREENYARAHYNRLKPVMENILKAARFQKTCYIQRTRKRMTADFSFQTMQRRKQRSNVLKVLKEKNLPRMLYPVKTAYKN